MTTPTKRPPDYAAAPAEGWRLPPCWHIVPPGAPVAEGRRAIVLSPGAGFGSGSHPTSQLCLQAIGMMAPRTDEPWRLLDFGSGSGILSVAAARMGARVDGVEIDEQAIAHAHETLALNGLTDRVSFHRDLAETPGPYAMVVANILRPVLAAFAEPLAARLAPGGTLVLSGLVATDTPELSVRYGALLGGQRPEVYQRGEWRALVWRGASIGGMVT